MLKLPQNTGSTERMPHDLLPNVVNSPDQEHQPISIELVPGVKMVFCWIPAGEFRMGSRYNRPTEQPVHRVIIPHDFLLAQTPVTQEQFALFDQNHQSYFQGKGKEKHPVESVTWQQAREFCQWLKDLHWPEQLANFEPDLPTEAQWEYACRAGTETDYYTGDGEEALARAGWYHGNSNGQTHEVWQPGMSESDFKTPNAFGLYDMHGNVWEWSRDVWAEHAYRHHADGRVEAMGNGGGLAKKDERPRVVRGGSWGDHPWFCRSAFRIRTHPGNWYHFQGFRVGLFPGPSCQEAEPG